MKTPDTINGKTPDEIKKGLECCMDYQSCTEYGEPKCPYNDVTKCMEALLSDALAYIQHLESRLAQDERERDAAVFALHGQCKACKNINVKCGNCTYWLCLLGNRVSEKPLVDNWEWRGVCAENTKEEEE